jgi:hypothetical protein
MKVIVLIEEEEVPIIRVLFLLLPMAIWAVMSLNNGRADQRNEKLIKAMRENNR